MLQQIYHKKNKFFEVEFFKDKECIELVTDFSKYKNLYIELKEGDITPLYSLPLITKDSGTVFISYFPLQTKPQHIKGWILKTLDNLNINLSKYIPEDNAVLFLSEKENYYEYFSDCSWKSYDTITDFFSNDTVKVLSYLGANKLTIPLPYITQETIQQANEVAKELKEKYRVEEVNLFGLHCFLKNIDAKYKIYTCDLGTISKWNINKIITTNSAGILEPTNKKKLQVIDCKEILIANK